MQTAQTININAAGWNFIKPLAEQRPPLRNSTDDAGDDAPFAAFHHAAAVNAFGVE
jgi:hypothetical protein